MIIIIVIEESLHLMMQDRVETRDLRVSVREYNRFTRLSELNSSVCARSNLCTYP